MANSFGTDILIQAQDPKKAASFYVKQLGFEITGEEAHITTVSADIEPSLPRSEAHSPWETRPCATRNHTG
jgi:catechol-2,3-dioxygenase